LGGPQVDVFSVVLWFGRSTNLSLFNVKSRPFNLFAELFTSSLASKHCNVFCLIKAIIKLIAQGIGIDDDYANAPFNNNLVGTWCSNAGGKLGN
jgi:hypothetical protein